MLYAVLYVCETHQNSYKQDTTNVKLMYDAQTMTAPVVKCLAQQFTLCISFLYLFATFFASLFFGLFISIQPEQSPRCTYSHSILKH